MKKYFFSLLLLLSLYSSCHASTSVSGVIGEDTTWLKSNSPYVITGPVVVDVGVKLTIEPGVTVSFEDNSELLVFGDIYSNGNISENVNFVGNSGFISLPNINVYDSIDSYFNFTNFENIKGINLFHSILSFNHINITNSEDGIITYSSVTDLSNSVIDTYDKSFVLSSASTGTISDSEIYTRNISRESAINVYEDGILDIKRSKIGSDITTPISLYLADVNFDSVLLESGLDYGIKIYDSKVNISSSTIKNFSNSGVIMYGTSNVNIVDSDIVDNNIGILEYESEDTKDLKLSSNRIFSNNVGLLAYGSNSYPSVIDARNNWWGDVSGPFVENLSGDSDLDNLANLSGAGNPIIFYGQEVKYKPWLLSPNENPTECCSDVIFLPGLQASRLYKKQILEDQLWEPNVLSSDIKYLYLNEDGTPKNTNIYTKDIIDRTNIGFAIKDVDIYKTFIEYMDGMVQSGDINSWRAFPYDWRFDYEDIITYGIKLQDKVEYMIPEIEKMASSSKTGKISIVTHSNGGLLAKVLVDKLRSQGKENLVDKLIMVAPPQVGTPKAISTILHGEEDPNFILTKEYTRNLGENMKSAYNLIPSKKYFENVLEPVVKFNTDISSISNLYSKYGNDINSYNEMVNFLKGNDGRLDPKSNDVISPNVLNASLLAYANRVHNEVDNLQAPLNIDVNQIAGWGVLTTSGIEYFKGKNCSSLVTTCSYFLDHKTIKTIDGDRTVVTPSASAILATSSKTYYLNLKDYNRENGEGAEHSNIMEVPSLQNLIRNIIINSNDNLPDYVSTEKPTISNYKNLRISMHSPVAIDAYDDNGNHTGLIKDQDSDNYFVDEKIPNSIYEEIGEGKYIYLDSEEGVTLKLSGLDTGTFTLQIENQENGSTISESSFADIPTTSNTEGELVFVDGQDPKLNIDIEGDGDVDIILEQGKELTPIEYLEFIKKTVNALNINKKIKDSIIKRIEKLIKLYEKNHDKKFIKKIREFNQQLKGLAKHRGHRHHKHQSDEEIKEVVDMVSKLLDSLEQK